MQNAKPNKDEDLTCNVCNKSFAIKDHMNRHMRDSHLSSSHGLKPNENGRIDCLTCDKTFANFTSAKRHFREIHAVTNQKFTCDLCGKIFNVKRNMKSHSRKCHQNASLKNQSQKSNSVNVEFNDEKHEAIEGEHVISQKKETTKSIEKPGIMHGLLVDNSKQIAKLTQRLGIAFVTSNSFDREYLKGIKSIEKSEKSHNLCHKCRKPFASCKKWC